ncbi:hypothetical protein RI129_010785 [Pyrocoelia pectoralis]|uniref:Membrane protein BRI3 n=1 Tax=Pyrocoelia pectoralis TaxID=417401 RepID=A0AAN7V9Y0_9COLE
MHPTVHKEPPYPLNAGSQNINPPQYTHIYGPTVPNPQNITNDQYQYTTRPIYSQPIPLNYGSTTTVPTATTIIVPPQIITVGACPACRIGVLEDDYTCLGLLCAILFFPIGILCCLALKNRRCSACGAYFG